MKKTKQFVYVHLYSMKNLFLFIFITRILSLVLTSDISISKIIKNKITKTKFCSVIAYARSLMLVLMLVSMFMSHASVNFFLSSFVLPCAYACVASEDQALGIQDGVTG